MTVSFNHRVALNSQVNMASNYGDSEEENGQSMYSNLPLLFAGGYPTSLDKITESQLEKFIPFMVQCSLGYTQLNQKFDYAEPEWWPEDIQFLIPFHKPTTFDGDWLARMKELVVICYSFHRSIFLLRFCKQLSVYDHASLRFINNRNSTTSLFHRTTNKLLVTFRNENMMYDQQPHNQRKSLLPKSPSAHTLEIQQHAMVEPALFDIYLCDYCDAELYSLEAYEEHEKICMANSANGDEAMDEDDDDVIFIDDEDGLQVVPGRGAQPEFLSNFGLCSTKAPINMSQSSQGRRSYGHMHLGEYFGSPDKQRRLPNRSRGVIALSKCATIPLSSPCGQLLLKQSKTMMSEDYQLERIDRIERFCHAPILFSNSDRPRYITTANQTNPKQSRFGNSTNVTYRKPTDQEETHYHLYKFPRRQLSTKHRSAHFNFLNSLLLKACKPVSVKVKRLSDTDIEICKAKLRQAAQKLSFEVPKDNQHVVEFIDLCSSDEEAEEIGIENDERMQSSGSAGTEVDENQLTPQQKLDGILMSMPINQNCSSLLVQPIPEPPKVLPLRPSIYLFSNYQRFSTSNNASNQLPSTQQSSVVTSSTQGFPQTGVACQSQEEFLAAKANSINEWINSTQNSMQIDHLSTANTNNIRQIPGLVNIQQYTTTAIRQTITTANIAT
uniref:CSON015176 protein n=2 Tax=Culicoides sonorensis TaxID=179676 RepID=A0A336LT97_CULSO